MRYAVGLVVVVLVALVWPLGLWNQRTIPQESLVEKGSCGRHNFGTRIISTDPLVLYLENFLAQEELHYLNNDLETNYTRSPVNENKVDSSIRTSSSTKLARNEVTRCIEERALSLTGFDPDSTVENLQLVRYQAGQAFSNHYDWGIRDDPRANGEERFATIFAYVGADCEGGDTRFPRLVGSGDSSLYTVGSPGQSGINFHPIKGNAIYWQNLHKNGTGDTRTLHSGTPIIRGEKKGLNIWIRQKA